MFEQPSAVTIINRVDNVNIHLWDQVSLGLKVSNSICFVFLPYIVTVRKKPKLRSDKLSVKDVRFTEYSDRLAVAIEVKRNLP